MQTIDYKKAIAYYRGFDNIIEGVQVISKDYRYLYVNDALATHGKYAKEELIGHTMMEKYPGIEKTLVFSKIQDCIVTGRSHNMENEFFFPDYTKGIFELRIQPIPDGVLILSLDITKRKNMELALEEKNTKLQSQNKVLEQFVYIASHDLQEPLRTVNSFVELLEEQYKGKFGEDADKYLNYISEASLRMKNLVKGLLDYSRIGVKRELVHADCNKIVKNIIADLDITIKESKAKVEIASLPTLTAYETELRLLFQNLLSNAIKFRKKDTDPCIEITSEKRDDKWLFKIQDNGVGFDVQYVHKIFTIFQRLHLRNEYSGTGIGLAHCKKIVELHGGDIWADSSPGTGSTFYFTIPAIINHNYE